MAVKAQILAPLTAQYSLRAFNECFEVVLADAGGPLKRYHWHFARWHNATWLAGQTAPQSATPRWRLKGHSMLLKAIEFLTSGEHLQHVAYGSRRVRKSDGTWIDFPKTERTRCPEELWKAFVASQPDGSRHVERSRFLELAMLVADTEQKSYGALDTYAEQNGRKQAELLRGYLGEVVSLCQALGHHSVLPSGENDGDNDDRQRQVAALAAAAKHADALRDKVTRVELFIKREMPSHVPSCMRSADGSFVRQSCPEHCMACRFGTESGDPSRAEACTIDHQLRCPQCAEVHSLPSDIDVMLKSVQSVLATARMTVGLMPVDADGDEPMGGDARAPTDADGDEMVDGDPAASARDSLPQQSVKSAVASFEELQLLVQRAAARFDFFHAHEHRAAHEEKVMEMLLQELGDTECILVADWKVHQTPRCMHAARWCSLAH